MEFVIEKEKVVNNLKSIDKVTALRGVQPVLSNVLIETIDEKTVKLCATDLDLAVEVEIQADILTQGSITLPSKKLIEIISKLPEAPINFSLNTETNSVAITCGNSKFDVIGISSAEFPEIANKELLESSEDCIEISVLPFLKAIKQTSYSAANYDSNNVLSGVFCSISKGKLEMAATDGNRLARVVEEIEYEGEKQVDVIIPSRTLKEFSSIFYGLEEEKLCIIAKKGQIVFKLNDRFLSSRLLEGQYPKYQQLIPEKGEKQAVVNREALINALDRTSVMVNERTSIIKFTFDENKLLLKADTPDAGASMDLIDVDYNDEELVIAFNYKYVLDCLKHMETDNVRIDLGGSLSATLFKSPENDDYISLVMPVQIR